MWTYRTYNMRTDFSSTQTSYKLKYFYLTSKCDLNISITCDSIPSLVVQKATFFMHGHMNDFINGSQRYHIKINLIGLTQTTKKHIGGLPLWESSLYGTTNCALPNYHELIKQSIIMVWNSCHGQENWLIRGNEWQREREGGRDWPQFLQWSTTQIDIANWTAIAF